MAACAVRGSSCNTRMDTVVPNARPPPVWAVSSGKALARDPQCARALAGISQAARLRVMVSDGDPEVEFPHAEAAVARALKIDPDSAEAYTEQGMLQFWYRWNWPKATRSCSPDASAHDARSR